ncbi:hypothetical protein [Thioalkalivibrio thiocyanodenitrificans]|uniref:hypothetical protein n=1 Tax=Thioalkalivibrio thiocyanodenitrificans TaxID=243063 RepID=UPI00037917E4|nr:hypothetical protein [Thioalkalivibrio thiocyanodenitrificans]
MKGIEQALIRFFEQVAQRDSVLLEKLNREGSFSVEDDRWDFTLPDLHRFLQCHQPVFGTIDYKAFRQAIFNSPVNQAVRTYDAEVIIADNQGKVDQSTYAMVWNTAESRP